MNNSLGVKTWGRKKGGKDEGRVTERAWRGMEHEGVAWGAGQKATGVWQSRQEAVQSREDLKGNRGCDELTYASERQVERRVRNRRGARSSHNDVRISPPVANSNKEELHFHPV